MVGCMSLFGQMAARTTGLFCALPDVKHIVVQPGPRGRAFPYAGRAGQQGPDIGVPDS